MDCFISGKLPYLVVEHDAGLAVPPKHRHDCQLSIAVQFARIALSELMQLRDRGDGAYILRLITSGSICAVSPRRVDDIIG